MDAAFGPPTACRFDVLGKKGYRCAMTDQTFFPEFRPRLNQCEAGGSVGRRNLYKPVSRGEADVPGQDEAEPIDEEAHASFLISYEYIYELQVEITGSVDGRDRYAVGASGARRVVIHRYQPKFEVASVKRTTAAISTRRLTLPR